MMTIVIPRSIIMAYLTVYLSLIFGIVLSLLFVFVEGAAIGAVRAQAELVADLGVVCQMFFDHTCSAIGTAIGGIYKKQLILL